MPDLSDESVPKEEQKSLHIILGRISLDKSFRLGFLAALDSAIKGSDAELESLQAFLKLNKYELSTDTLLWLYRIRIAFYNTIDRHISPIELIDGGPQKPGKFGRLF